MTLALYGRKNNYFQVCFLAYIKLSVVGK